MGYGDCPRSFRRLSGFQACHKGFNARARDADRTPEMNRCQLALLEQPIERATRELEKRARFRNLVEQ